VVRSSSTASPSAPVEEASAAAVPTGDAEEERVVLPTNDNESSETLLRIRHTVLLLPFSPYVTVLELA
jgi:threonyl-tRNA synthetase